MKTIQLRLSAAMVALAVASSAAMAEGKLVISNWDGYMPAELPEQFATATGIEAEVSFHATNEEIMGKVVASGGKGYDVLFVSSPFAEALNKLGLTAPIDASKIPNMKNLYPEANELAYDPGNTFSVPYAWGTTGLCYRSDLLSTTPDSWNDLLTPADDLKGDVAFTANNERSRAESAEDDALFQAGVLLAAQAESELENGFTDRFIMRCMSSSRNSP